jgi:hypothetical protein
MKLKWSKLFNKRFTKLSAALAVSTEKIKRVGPAAPLRSSEKNRKLALQMASRPSVQAALRIKNVGDFFFKIYLYFLRENYVTNFLSIIFDRKR